MMPWRLLGCTNVKRVYGIEGNSQCLPQATDSPLYNHNDRKTAGRQGYVRRQLNSQSVNQTEQVLRSINTACEKIFVWRTMSLPADCNGMILISSWMLCKGPSMFSSGNDRNPYWSREHTFDNWSRGGLYVIYQNYCYSQPNAGNVYQSIWLVFAARLWGYYKSVWPYVTDTYFSHAQSECRWQKIDILEWYSQSNINFLCQFACAWIIDLADVTTPVRHVRVLNTKLE